MKRWQLFTSLGVNVVLAVVLVLVLWPGEPTPVDLSQYTQQDLAKTTEIEPGMSRQNVLAHLGPPIARVFESDFEEWHYCRTGNSVDEYAAVEIRNGKVVGLRRYTVSWLDVVFRHTDQPTEALIEVSGLGDCKLTVGGVDGSYFTPNNKIQPTADAAAD